MSSVRSFLPILRHQNFPLRALHQRGKPLIDPVPIDLQESTEKSHQKKRGRKTHRYNMDNQSDSADANPQKQLLMDAAAEIRADQVAREKARPQNVGQGTMRLVGDSLGGVALGAAAVVMGPVQGYKQSGPKGIVSGALGGVALGVASTTFGIGSGIANFVQGTSRSAAKLNPPKTDSRIIIDHAGNGLITGSDPKQAYLLERKRLYAELMAEHSTESAAASMDGLVPPVDNELYHVLEVEVDATPAQIRKAYYRMAQLYHPDKHPNDAEATAKFQKVSNAYQVLSDPVKREEYHRVGASAATGEAMVDPKALFILMFADFEHIVGDLATATILKTTPEDDDQEGNSSSEASTANDPGAEARKEQRKEAREKKRDQFQQLREKQLVKLLERRLEPWISGNEVEFIEHAKHEVLYLRDEPFGRDCLKTAGYIYRKRAGKLLESKGPFNGVSSFFEDLGDKAHSFKSQLRALEGGVKAMTTTERAESNESIDETARREAVSTLGAVWLASVVDIEKTLRKVVSMVLHLDNKELAKSPEVKKKAEGLMILGKIFEQA